jgi:hypothetical protein
VQLLAAMFWTVRNTRKNQLIKPADTYEAYAYSKDIALTQL